MPEDVAWCRNNTKFKEKDLLKLLKRFRAKCVKGEMNKDHFAELYKKSYPLGNPEDAAEAVFEALDPDRKEKLDFKERIIGEVVKSPK